MGETLVWYFFSSPSYIFEHMMFRFISSCHLLPELLKSFHLYRPANPQQLGTIWTWPRSFYQSCGPGIHQSYMPVLLNSQPSFQFFEFSAILSSACVQHLGSTASPFPDQCLQGTEQYVWSSLVLSPLYRTGQIEQCLVLPGISALVQEVSEQVPFPHLSDLHLFVSFKTISRLRMIFCSKYEAI